LEDQVWPIGWSEEGDNELMLGLESPSHIIIILIIALVVFGPKRLPEIGRSLGQGIRQFRGSLDSVDPTKPPAEAPQSSPVLPPAAERPVDPPAGATPR
jgi:sec-independent protein translocase protein TatA